MSWVWPIAFGVGTVLFLALLKILVRFALVRIFSSLEAYRAFVLEPARTIARRSS